MVVYVGYGWYLAVKVIS